MSHLTIACVSVSLREQMNELIAELTSDLLINWAHERVSSGKNTFGRMISIHIF